MSGAKMSLGALASASMQGLQDASDRAGQLLGDGYDIFQLPEGPLVFHVAMAIRRHVQSARPWFEHSSNSVVRDGGVRRRGRPSTALESNGRFDIAVYDEADEPRGLVEVKNMATSASPLLDDLKRLCATLNSFNESSLRYAVAVIPIYGAKPQEEDARIALVERLRSLKSDIQGYLKNSRCSIQIFSGGERISPWSRKQDGHWIHIWQPVAIGVKRRPATA